MGTGRVRARRRRSHGAAAPRRPQSREVLRRGDGTAGARRPTARRRDAAGKRRRTTSRRLQHRDSFTTRSRPRHRAPLRRGRGIQHWRDRRARDGRLVRVDWTGGTARDQPLPPGRGPVLAGPRSARRRVRHRALHRDARDVRHGHEASSRVRRAPRRADRRPSQERSGVDAKDLQWLPGVPPQPPRSRGAAVQFRGCPRGSCTPRRAMGTSPTKNDGTSRRALTQPSSRFPARASFSPTTSRSESPSTSSRHSHTRSASRSDDELVGRSQLTPWSRSRATCRTGSASGRRGTRDPRRVEDPGGALLGSEGRAR